MNVLNLDYKYHFMDVSSYINVFYFARILSTHFLSSDVMKQDY